jgi:carbamoyltransferase
MAQSFERYGRKFPWLRAASYHLTRPLIRGYARRKGLYDGQNPYAQERAQALRARLERGETCHVIGLGIAGHNSGTALVEVSKRDGVRIIGNHEEERYAQVKHCKLLPEFSLDVVTRQVEACGLRMSDVHAYTASWDYVDFAASVAGEIMAELPGSLVLLRPQAWPTTNGKDLLQALKSSAWLTRRLGLKRQQPIIGLRHHDNHAYFSYAASPFARTGEPVMVAVIDGSGDDGSVTLYMARNSEVRQVYNNRSNFDSIGMVYAHLSSALGGWTLLSSEGRYMGASAWGNLNRLTNPYYLQLRQLVYFAPKGELFVNRKWANWQKAGVITPYTAALAKIIGPPVPLDKMWNPDAVLSVEDIQHSPINQDRVDKAAAVQLLFEDMLFHVIAELVRTTGSHKLVLTGGTALNCVANMRLLEHFNEDYYERYLQKKNTRLELWVPPIPNDPGTPVGAAYHFALRSGASLGEPLQHAFYCGEDPTSGQIRAALGAISEINYLSLGRFVGPKRCAQVADLLAWLVSQNAVLGLFQGKAETGPRALGHRSILANPCNARTRETLNQMVKFRELVRPLAPMATYEGAHRWFDLPPGASADHYNAYNYMVLTARARREAFAVIPAVIHVDGTARVQIVRRDTDPFCYSYLKAMGRRVGAEVSVNTSLNIGSPIVQTPEQALHCLKKSTGMTGLFMIGSDGEMFLAWHDTDQPPKERGATLRNLVQRWQNEAFVTPSV